MISIIVAVAQNGAIGKNNNLLWHLPDDMAFFKQKTKGHAIITGRKNYESIPEKFRPLPNRTNIVVSRQSDYHAPGSIVVSNLEEAISTALKISNDEIFIIGGGEIYRQALPLVDKIYLTRVNHTFEADTFFPEFNAEDWEETSRTHHPADDRHPFDFAFLVLERKS